MFTNNKGFSLIEILVTVGLVGILASVAVPSYQGYKRNTIKMAMRADVSNGQKVYSAKYAIDGDYCYNFEDVGLSKAKDSSPIYRNKGFYGFGGTGSGDGACSGVDIEDVQFIFKGGTCSINTHTTKSACEGAGETWTQRADTAGANAASCELKTNDFLIGAYTNASSLDTFIQANHEGIIQESSGTADCTTP